MRAESTLFIAVFSTEQYLGISKHLVSQSIPAVSYNKILGNLQTTEISNFTVLKAEKFKIKVLEDLASGEGLFLIW